MPLTDSEAAQLFRDEPHRFLDVGAGEVAHRKIGSGPDVLFVHGWPVSGATWRKLLPHLVDHVTCHVIDLPSAGSSRFDADTPMSIQQHITSVQRVVDLLGLDEISVVGHNKGRIGSPKPPASLTEKPHSPTDVANWPRTAADHHSTPGRQISARRRRDVFYGWKCPGG